MDYQRACGAMGRGMPYRSRGNQPRQMNWQATPTTEFGMTDSRISEESTCCEHLAIVTSPIQCWQNLHAPCEALSMGTLFKDLHLPLVGCPGSTCGYRKNGGLL